MTLLNISEFFSQCCQTVENRLRSPLGIMGDRLKGGGSFKPPSQYGCAVMFEGVSGRVANGHACREAPGSRTAVHLVFVRAEKPILNLVKSNRNQIVFTVFWLLLNRTEFHLLSQINGKSVITIEIWLDSIISKIGFYVCTYSFFSSVCFFFSLVCWRVRIPRGQGVSKQIMGGKGA